MWSWRATASSRSLRRSTACELSRTLLAALQADGVHLRSSEEQKQADGQELFDFCAECLGRFIQDHYGDEDGNVDLEEDLSLGFTFSYPCM